MSVHGFSSITGLQGQFMGSVSSPVYKFSLWVHKHHWPTRSVLRFSSITGLQGQFKGFSIIAGLQGQFMSSAASLVYYVSSRVQQYHWFTFKSKGLAA